MFTDAQQQLRGVQWADCAGRTLRCADRLDADSALDTQRAPAPSRAAEALRAYFAGNVTAIAGVSVPQVGTAFQQQVWAALRQVPCGATASYGEIAAKIGRPSACRAVGLANGANPICIIVPCHRVIGRKAALTGYAGGLERKRWLLEHERRHHGSTTGESRNP